jgi:hypothetical protein
VAEWILKVNIDLIYGEELPTRTTSEEESEEEQRTREKTNSMNPSCNIPTCGLPLVGCGPPREDMISKFEGGVVGCTRGDRLTWRLKLLLSCKISLSCSEDEDEEGEEDLLGGTARGLDI